MLLEDPESPGGLAIRRSRSGLRKPPTCPSTQGPDFEKAMAPGGITLVRRAEFGYDVRCGRQGAPLTLAFAFKPGESSLFGKLLFGRGRAALGETGFTPTGPVFPHLIWTLLQTNS